MMLNVFVFSSGFHFPGAGEVVLQAVHDIDEERRRPTRLTTYLLMILFLCILRTMIVQYYVIRIVIFYTIMLYIIFI